MAQLYFEDVNVGDEVTPLHKNASSQQLVKYAGASGDYYQIHYDDGFARNNGLDGIIIHGALKSAFLGQLITDWMGPPGQLKKLSVSYRAMDFPKEEPACRGPACGTPRARTSPAAATDKIKGSAKQGRPLVFSGKQSG